MYIDHYGEVQYTNYNTKDTGFLALNKHGWTSKGAHEMTGWVKDKNGKIRYTMKGKWNESMKVINEDTKEETVIWKKNPVIANWEEQYCFTNFTVQLNNLTADLVVKLPATDTRLRPDQRALEYGNVQLAISEKFRLEEKQRARRKDMTVKGEMHKARWFREYKDQFSGEKSWEYSGGYWESRENNKWEKIIDMY